ncbi:4F2 cell-surface antigen heavy chain-like [Protopterus annectens]|uniref:4F2 cell-surface antigen heavy chain-like n=1 Tax=Protopterus annectens TaxID=7888 RepID=UPI001CF9FDE5|nr:4F2 cell-surface antigen heavy chain-like [Protopterus annectens]XP_043940689.1 4F2 cell-surface antigen heavy chain-like [Protopterus annectens]
MQIEDLEKVPILHHSGKESSTTKLLCKELVMQQAETWFWVVVHRGLLVIFLLAWFAMLIGAVFILLQSPNNRPQLHWWQHSVFYHIEPAVFLDSDGDGMGDLAGIQKQLSYFGRLKVQALIIAPIYKLEGNGSGFNFTEINPFYGSMEDFDKLVSESKKHGIRILFEIRDWTGNRVSTSWQTSASSWKSSIDKPDRLKEILDFWLKKGVSGFLFANQTGQLIKKVTDEWKEHVQNYTSKEDDERILMIAGSSAIQPCQNMSECFEANLIQTFNLFGGKRNLSVQAMLQQMEEAILWNSNEYWPAWMIGSPSVGHMASFVKELHRAYSVLLLMLPGSPVIYYGDEIGLKDLKNGKKLPVMKWKPSEHTQALKKALVRDDDHLASVEEQQTQKKSLLRLFSSLLAVKWREPALHYGNITMLNSSSDSISFLRHWSCSTFLITMNLGQESLVLDFHPFGLPPKAQIVVSSNQDRHGEVDLGCLQLSSKESLVLKPVKGNAS